LRFSGQLIGGLALAALVVCGIKALPRTVSEASDVLRSPARTTPINQGIELHRGQYTIFELTGRQSGGGGLTFSENGFTTFAPDDVHVTDASGQPAAVTPLGAVAERLTRGSDIYTGALHIQVPATGRYQVQILSVTPETLVIAPSLGSTFAAISGWLVVGGISVVILFIGLVLLLRGVSIGRALGAAPNWPPAGWYADPSVPGRGRYWDGRAWTPYLR
jgi:hypothetical protein